MKARASALIGNAQADFTRVERPSEGRCATRAAPQEGRAGTNNHEHRSLAAVSRI